MSVAENHPCIVELVRELDELKAEWRRQGAPIYGALRPGLDARGLDALERELGVTLPPELRGLWAWHDGAEIDRSTIGPGHYAFLPTEWVVKAHRENMETHPAGEYEDAPDFYWHPTWIPFMNQGPQRLYIDTSRHAWSQASPVRVVTWEWEDWDVDLAPSLKTLTRTWTWLLSEGYYTWDHARGDWTDRYADIPSPLRGSF